MLRELLVCVYLLPVLQAQDVSRELRDLYAADQADREVPALALVVFQRLHTANGVRVTLAVPGAHRAAGRGQAAIAGRTAEAKAEMMRTA